ncbi:prepilin-type N-terminal cleavage/methylation domain-containing protein [Noviherbaspirillum saxi]|uniref:Prepilin-type N-terminal cleavage/methylation domain-containing protein n=1 Tax=Noviherbaspirillum saxi TaxID=2320863 RepID=A0A3A3G9K3_9BURK|nr:prepilin-type N-terminal cleavage/methylation domain-containing protein [Noviherbaspirillum saxi]RJF98845.1 prepilin-type N-terminal cleavage/methylation domain-containing protein [Noviherbaspirillum saxi]
MSIKRQDGMTMIELIMAIVILGVGIAGVLSAFTTVVKSSADPMIRKQMLAIAEGMMEEITLQSFAATAPAPSITPGACPDRGTFNDIRDYHGMQTASGFCDTAGTPIPDLAAYNVAVAVNPAGGLNTVAGSGSIAGGNVLQITVTVTHGAESLELVGWRTNYAAGLPN